MFIKNIQYKNNGAIVFIMEDGIERSMSMLIQENEQKKQTVRKPQNKTNMNRLPEDWPPQAAFGWPPAVSVEQVHPIGLSLPTDRNASSYPLTTDRNTSSYPLRTDTTHLTSTNSGS